MKNLLNIIVVIFVMCFGGQAVQGDIFIDVQDLVPGNPGQNGVLVGVFASSNAGDALNGFNLPFDVNNDGFQLPPGLTFNASPIQNQNPSFSVAATFSTGPGALYTLLSIDAVVSSVGNPNVTLSSTPIKLFDLAFDIAPLPAIPEGTLVPINLDVNVLYSVAPPVASSVSAGSLLVTAIPESSRLITGALGSIAAVVVLVSTYRRRRVATV
jgi:hypothetical protein